MHQKKYFKSTIGIVLSSIPGYSETFFRNKIKGLQENGFEVVLFVDYINDSHEDFPCTIISAADFSGGVFTTLFNSVLILIKTVFLYPKRSFKLYFLDKNDAVPLKKRIKNLILNQFLLSRNLDWLHFGYGMLANNRENIATAIGAKMAVSFRGFDLYLSPLKHKKCYKLLFSKDVKYHVLSKKMKEILKSYQIPESKIKTITPAIDSEFFQVQENTNNDTVFNIITVARLHWVKGLDYTLEALSLLKKEGVNFKYTIIGDGIERERLVFAAHQFGITDNITFIGKLSYKEVKKQLAKANIYLQYSIQEGFCNAALEAQAMGLLCVVSDADGLIENVIDKKTGWVVPKRQPELLKQKIKDVINMSNEDKQFIRQNAIIRIKREFNLKKQNVAFLNFYEQ